MGRGKEMGAIDMDYCGECDRAQSDLVKHGCKHHDSPSSFVCLELGMMYTFRASELSAQIMTASVYDPA